MSPDEFRRHGHDLIDWLANYLATVRGYPVLPPASPGKLTDQLPPEAPQTGEPFDAIFAGFERLIVPALTHWNHPRFFAYFAVSGSPPGILGELLAAGLNVNGMLWKSCPAATELEQVTLGWLREWIGLPPEYFGILYDTASISSLHAIAAARYLADPSVAEHGDSSRLVLYTSEQAHSSIEKSAITIGIGRRNIRKVAVDAEFRMRPDGLREAIQEDLRSGLQPFCIVATVGTTSSSSIDPVPEVASVSEEHGLWLHVDAAYGGTAAVVPEMRAVLAGAERAHSLVVNPHKWLFTPVDCSAFFTRRPDILRNAFSLIPEYLRTAEDPRAINLMDYGVQLGRRFRALKLWFVMRHYGRDGVVQIIRHHIEYAHKLAALIVESGRFELAAPVPFSLVCFRYRGSEEENRRILESVNLSGFAFLSHTLLNGKYTLRFAIGHVETTWEDVSATWDAIQAAASKVQAEATGTEGSSGLA